MAQIPKGRLVKGPYKPICRDCAIYFSITVTWPDNNIDLNQFEKISLPTGSMRRTAKKLISINLRILIHH